jgi:pyruvate-ferredoxin/flavodoxin oxidoreductase
MAEASSDHSNSESANPASSVDPVEPRPAPKYPGTPQAMDGSTAVVAVETAASEAAGAYPITPSTQMGEGWADAVAKGKTNVHGRRLLFFEPEGEHAAAAVTAGMSMVGLRAANFSAGQGVAYMHESLYAAVGKRLTYVLNIAARAITKQSLNIHCGHDDYHAVDDTGFFQLFGKDVQEVSDLNLIAHRIAELSLNPGICAQDGFLTSHVIESLRLAEPQLVAEFLGAPDDFIESPTPAQRIVFGERRRRIPELFDFDNPAILGPVQNQESYAQGVAAQRPFYFDHIVEIADQAFEEFGALTGRRYARVLGYRVEDAEYVIVGQGSLVANAEAVCDHLRDNRDIKAGVIDLIMFRPFPADLISQMLRGNAKSARRWGRPSRTVVLPMHTSRTPAYPDSGPKRSPTSTRVVTEWAVAIPNRGTSSPPWNRCFPTAAADVSSTSESTSRAAEGGRVPSTIGSSRWPTSTPGWPIWR